MFTKDLLTPSKHDVNMYGIPSVTLDGHKSSFTTIQLFWTVTRKPSGTNPNIEMDTENDADHKRFFPHALSIAMIEP